MRYGTEGTADEDRGAGDGVAVGGGRTDEFTRRRVMRAVDEGYRQLVADPERLAAVDREIDAEDLQDSALDIGRAAYARGDYNLAERELLLSHNRTFGDSSVYLTALYRLCGERAMAEGWWIIARAEGFDQAALDEVLAAAPTAPQHD